MSWKLIERYSPVEPLPYYAYSFLLHIEWCGPTNPETFLRQEAHLDYDKPYIPSFTGRRDIAHLIQEGYISVHHSTQKDGKRYRYYTLSPKGEEYVRKIKEFEKIGGEQSQKIAEDAFPSLTVCGYFTTVSKQGGNKPAPDLVAKSYNLPHLSFGDSWGTKSVEIESPTELKHHPEQVEKNLKKWEELGFDGLIVRVKDEKDLKYFLDKYTNSDIQTDKIELCAGADTPGPYSKISETLKRKKPTKVKVKNPFKYDGEEFQPGQKLKIPEDLPEAAAETAIEKGYAERTAESTLPESTAEGPPEEGDTVEISAGPFEGEKAKVVEVDYNKKEATIEMVEATVPIPVTVGEGQVRVVEKG